MPRSWGIQWLECSTATRVWLSVEHKPQVCVVQERAVQFIQDWWEPPRGLEMTWSSTFEGTLAMVGRTSRMEARAKGLETFGRSQQKLKQENGNCYISRWLCHPSQTALLGADAFNSVLPLTLSLSPGRAQGVWDVFSTCQMVKGSFLSYRNLRERSQSPTLPALGSDAPRSLSWLSSWVPALPLDANFRGKVTFKRQNPDWGKHKDNTDEGVYI